MHGAYPHESDINRSKRIQYPHESDINRSKRIQEYRVIANWQGQCNSICISVMSEDIIMFPSLVIRGLRNCLCLMWRPFWRTLS